MEINEIKKELNSKATDMANYLIYLLSIQENLEIIDLKIKEQKRA